MPVCPIPPSAPVPSNPLRTIGFVLLIGLALACAPFPARADTTVKQAPSTKPTAGAADHAAEIQQLLVESHKPATSPARKKEIVARLLELGGEGPRLLAIQCEREFRTKNPAYLTKLEHEAADAVKASWKGKGDIEKQVTELRKTVLDVSHAPNLTEKMIRETADPAMKKLDELITITPDGVMEAKPDLKADRQELLDLVAAWHQAAERVPDDHRKSMSPAAAAAPGPAAFEAELQSREKLAAMMAMPMSKADRAVLLANLPLAEKLDPAEAKGILVLNLLRVRLGLGAQMIDPKLYKAARGHSTDMREKKFFSHVSPVPGKEDFGKRAAAAGTSAHSENIYAGSERGDDAIETWWHSPGHHKNMAGGSHRVGLGRSGKLWTQMFGE